MPLCYWTVPPQVVSHQKHHVSTMNTLLYASRTLSKPAQANTHSWDYFWYQQSSCVTVEKSQVCQCWQHHSQHTLAEQQTIESQWEAGCYGPVPLWEWKETRWTVLYIGTIPRHARDKLNTPIQSCPLGTIQSLLLSNQFPALQRDSQFTPKLNDFSRESVSIWIDNITSKYIMYLFNLNYSGNYHWEQSCLFQEQPVHTNTATHIQTWAAQYNHSVICWTPSSSIGAVGG